MKNLGNIFFLNRFTVLWHIVKENIQSHNCTSYANYQII